MKKVNQTTNILKCLKSSALSHAFWSKSLSPLVHKTWHDPHLAWLCLHLVSHSGSVCFGHTVVERVKLIQRYSSQHAFLHLPHDWLSMHPMEAFHINPI